MKTQQKKKNQGVGLLGAQIRDSDRQPRVLYFIYFGTSMPQTNIGELTVSTVYMYRL